MSGAPETALNLEEIRIRPIEQRWLRLFEHDPG